MGLGELVLEVVQVLSVDDVDRHFASKPNELTSAGIWHDSDSELQGTARHGATVLQCEGAALTMKRSDDSLNRDVTGRVFDIRAGGQHLALAGSFEVAVELLVD